MTAHYMTPAQRVEHEKYRAVQFRRVVEDGADRGLGFSQGQGAGQRVALFGAGDQDVDIHRPAQHRRGRPALLVKAPA